MIKLERLEVKDVGDGGFGEQILFIICFYFLFLFFLFCFFEGCAEYEVWGFKLWNFETRKADLNHKKIEFFRSNLEHLRTKLGKYKKGCVKFSYLKFFIAIQKL